MNINNIVGNGKEIKELTEISDVTFENNRLVLRVEDPVAARKFDLSDKTYKYEFDGSTMYWYYDKDEKARSGWSCTCGRGGHTLVDAGTDRQIRAVKDEMAKQIVLKKMHKYFGNDKRFTGVAIELNRFYYTRDGFLVER